MATRVTSKGQVTIPKPVRDRLGIKPGDSVAFVEDGDVVTVRKIVEQDPFAPWVGFLGNLRGRKSDDLVREMRGD